MRTQFETIEEVEELTSTWSHSDWFSAHNQYCDNNDYSDDQIFEFDDDFFDTYFDGKPMEAARATHFGDVNWNDDYIRFNGYGNLESINKYAIENKIDTSGIIADIFENPENYSL